jgi:hypothetical protein
MNGSRLLMRPGGSYAAGCSSRALTLRQGVRMFEAIWVVGGLLRF